MPENLKLLSWNVNGIRAAHKKGLLEWMGEASPDILCVQETKATPEQLPKDLLEPPGYHAYWDSADKKGYSGVAVYTKTPPLAVERGLGIERFDSEGRVLMLDFDRFIVFNVSLSKWQEGSGTTTVQARLLRCVPRQDPEVAQAAGITGLLR